MNGAHFDHLARSINRALARRDLFHSFAGGTFGALAVVLPVSISAKKNKKPTPNQFGCLNVGQTCRGKDSTCCSGVCQGKKPKKGKKDKRKCAPHNDSICTPQKALCFSDMDTSCGFGCLCMLTTGNAGFCGNFFYLIRNDIDPCRECTRDTDCEGEFGSGAACIVVEGGNCGPLCPTTGRACIPACV